MKKPETLLKEYVSHLSDDEVRFLFTRFDQKLCNDTAESLQFISRNPDMDYWLASARSHSDFFRMMDQVESAIKREYNSRSLMETAECG